MKKVDLTSGNVLNTIIALAMPLVGTSLLQFTYNLIDMIWVGGLGSNAVASIGSSSFFIGMGYAINAMVVVGGSVKVAHAIGAKEEKMTNKYINTAFALNLTIGILYATCIVLFGKNLLDYLGINNLEVEKDALSYLIISGVSMIIVFFNTLFTRIFSSFGNNKISLKISGIGILLNIVLDPIFIYTLNLGVNGAAIATTISNLVVFIMSIKASKGLYRFNLIKYFDIKMLKEIVVLGFPNAAQRVIFTLINISLAKIIAIYGAEAIAAQKIGLQIESITFTIIGGFNGATSSFIGQNIGAKKIDRISKGYNICIKLGIFYTFLITLVLLFIPDKIAQIFVKDALTIKITADYLRIIGVSQILASVEMITNGAFIGLGATKYAASISIGLTLIRIPLAIVLVKFLGVNGIWWSIAISSMVKGVVSFTVYKFILFKKISKKYCIEKAEN